MRGSRLWLIAMICLGAARGQQPYEIKSTFDTDADGWTCVGAFFEYRPGGGNPGGYLFLDPFERDIFAECVAPPRFLGNLTIFDGGRLSFDGNMLLSTTDDWLPERYPTSVLLNYGTITIVGGGIVAKKDIVPGRPPDKSWASWSTTLSASEWGKTPAEWRQLLANVTAIRINLEAIYGEEQQALDNVVLRALTGPPLPLSVQNESLPDGEVGQPYTAGLFGTGGTPFGTVPSYRFSASGLPPGLATTDLGRFIAGTPEKAGTYQVVVTVTDSTGATASKTFTVKIIDPTRPLQLNTTTLPNAVAGSRYDATLLATGGNPPYYFEWTLDVSSFALDGGRGTITGLPTVAAYPEPTALPVTITVTDSKGVKVSKSMTLPVDTVPAIIDTALPPGQVGVGYSYDLGVAGGTTPHTWDRVGNLPPGLTIDGATGIISGVPTAAGTYSFRVHVEDKYSLSDEDPFQIVIGTTAVSQATPTSSTLSGKAFAGGVATPTNAAFITGSDVGNPGFLTIDYAGTAPWGRLIDPLGNLLANRIPSPATVEASCDPSGQAPGSYSTIVRVGGAPLRIQCRYSEPKAELKVVPDTITLEGPKSQRLFVFADGQAKDSQTEIRVTSTEPSVNIKALNAIARALRPAAFEIGRALPQLNFFFGNVFVEAVESVILRPRPVPLFALPKTGLSVSPKGITTNSANETARLNLSNPTDRTIHYSTRVSNFGLDLSLDKPEGDLPPGSAQTTMVRVAGGNGSGMIYLDDGLRITQVPVTARSSPSLVTPSAMIFRPGSAPQGMRITNVRATSVPYNCASDGSVSITPATGTITGNGSVTVGVTPIASATAKVGTVTCNAGGQVGVSYTFVAPVSTAACSASQLYPLPTNVPPNFVQAGGAPQEVRVSVVDNCGARVSGALVGLVAQGSNRYMEFQETAEGEYSATAVLAPGPYSGTIFVSSGSGTGGVAAKTPAAGEQALSGQLTLSGAVLAAPSGTPALDDESPYQGASFAEYSPAASGAFMTLRGGELASAPTPASTIPLPDDLGGASVYVGGRKAPLHYVSPGQINFLVPYGLPKNTTLDVLVKRGDRLSASIPIRMVDAAPGIFTYDSSGSGPGLVYDASYSFITSLRPAAVGQTVTLLATGLGDVDPALTADQQTASDVRRTVLPVKVTVGGKQAEMLFAGLLSGYAGVYQVAFVLPAGVSGNAVPLQIEVGGYTSNEVTIAVR